MRRQILALALMILGLAGTASVVAGKITIVVENPTSNSDQTGVATIRGWAVSTVGIDRVELKINGEVDSDLPYGGRRDDVGDAFPDIPGSEFSGFAAAYTFSKLEPGLNRMTFTVFDTDGDKKTVVVNFTAVKFHQDFFQQPSPLSITESVVLFSGDDVVITNANMGGERYALVLGWGSKAQNVTIKSNAPAGYFGPQHDGQWQGFVRPDTLRDINNLVCGNVDIIFAINNGILSGNGLDTRGIVYVASGSIAGSGLISGGSLSSGGQAGIVFDGSVTDGVMGGSWQGALGCAGRWFAVQL